MNRPSVCVVPIAWGGHRGADPTCMWVWGQGPCNFVLAFFHPFLSGFSAHVFFQCFIILVKELGLLTNMSPWIKGLDVAGTYI
jgi:hypothetical protein